MNRTRLLTCAACSLGMVLGFLATEASARREVFSPEQKAKLEKADRLLIDVTAITDQGPVSSGPPSEVVIRRMKEVGYTTLTDPAQPHDLVFKVKCEQRKTWEGTMASGGDADLPDSPSRVWKGPACQFSYLLDGKKMGWRKEVRTEFPDAIKAAAEAKAGDPGAYAMSKLKTKLEEYDFPVLVTAEWGQERRLLTLLDSPGTTGTRKATIITQLGDLFAIEAVPRLQAALKDPDPNVSKAAALALGNIGHKESVATLVDALETGPPALRVAAAKGLGQVGVLHGDVSVIPPLLAALNTDDLVLKTELVWALGKLPDRRAYEPLFQIYQPLQRVSGPDTDPQILKLKEALNWSMKQIDTWEYIQ
ncbi:MAG: HEAT repeat domain-containing protein [Nitrospiraceae bacterium]